MAFVVGLIFVAAFFMSVIFRCVIFHPIATVKNAIIDSRKRIKYKEANNYKTGDLNIYCGYFGSGKTLSLVHKVASIYRRYNDLLVYDTERKKIVKQRILILSNVDLAIPYVPLESLAQVVAAADANKIYDAENDTLTCTVVCMDELSVQMNSRSFRDNIDAYFLNTLMCCRHYHISFYGSAQRFAHVDKLMRDVTMSVIQCKKIWRFQINSFFDAWELENAANPENIRPLVRRCWFVHDSDYNMYDTLAVVDNLKKKYNAGDILAESEILANQAPTEPNMDLISKPSKKYMHSQKKKR